MQTLQNATNFHADGDMSEPFSVDIFSERRRFTPPVWIILLYALYRWSVSIFIPFFAYLALAGLAVYLIVKPIEVPLDTTNTVNITLIIFVGMVIPGVLLIVWYRFVPWWFLNGIDYNWQLFKLIAEENGHRFPDDFWHPFLDDRLGVSEDAFADELMIDSKTDIKGFIGSTWTISGDCKQGFDLYLEGGYWKLEKYGLRFYGDRMNIFIPYRAIQTVKSERLDVIPLKFDTAMTGRWMDIRIVMSHLSTKRGNKMLRNELSRRIAAAKASDLMEQLNDVLERT